MSSINPRADPVMNGRVAIVTGGAGWLGSVMTEALAAAGAQVVIASRDGEVGGAFARSVVEAGYRVRHVAYDQGDEASIENLVGDVLGAEGRIDVLVNNAAAWPMRDRQGPIADFARSMQVNLTGLFSLTRRVARHMAATDGGSIVNVGSSFGQVAPDFAIYEGIAPNSGLPDYFIHKGGMLQLTRYFAAAFGKEKVRVNTLVLGPFRKKQTEELAARFAGRTLLQRMGDVREVQGPLLFLASDASSYVTGSHLVVDGGYTAI